MLQLPLSARALATARPMPLAIFGSSQSQLLVRMIGIHVPPPVMSATFPISIARGPRSLGADKERDNTVLSTQAHEGYALCLRRPAFPTLHKRTSYRAGGAAIELRNNEGRVSVAPRTIIHVLASLVNCCGFLSTS